MTKMSKIIDTWKLRVENPHRRVTNLWIESIWCLYYMNLIRKVIYFVIWDVSIIYLFIYLFIQLFTNCLSTSKYTIFQNQLVVFLDRLDRLHSFLHPKSSTEGDCDWEILAHIFKFSDRFSTLNCFSFRWKI